MRAGLLASYVTPLLLEVGLPVIKNLRNFFRREIMLEINEMDAEKLVLTALFRAAPKTNSRDWDLKSVTRLQMALSAAQQRQTKGQIEAGMLPIALTERDWKAVGRLCLTLGENEEDKWARNIAHRIFADAIRRGKV